MDFSGHLGTEKQTENTMFDTSPEVVMVTVSKQLSIYAVYPADTE